MVSNYELAERIEKIIAARESIGAFCNQSLRTAVARIGVSEICVAEYYFQHDELPQDLGTRRQKSIRDIVIEAIINPYAHEDIVRRYFRGESLYGQKARSGRNSRR